MRTLGALILLGGLFAAGCSHSVTIITDPEDCRVFVDGGYVGMTPIIKYVPPPRVYSGSRAPSPYLFRIERDGYEPFEFTVAAPIRDDVVMRTTLHRSGGRR